MDRDTDCQNAAVTRGSLSETSSRGRAWSRNTVSMKTRAQPCAEIDSLSAARCTVEEHKNTVILVRVFGETEDEVH